MKKENCYLFTVVVTPRQGEPDLIEVWRRPGYKTAKQVRISQREVVRVASSQPGGRPGRHSGAWGYHTRLPLGHSLVAFSLEEAVERYQIRNQESIARKEAELAVLRAESAALDAFFRELNNAPSTST